MDKEENLTDYLLRKGFIEAARPVRGLDLDSVAGTVGGYEAEFGVKSIPNQNSVEVFYRVLLRNPPDIPFFLWDKCPVGNLAHLGEDESHGYVTIRGRKWLTKTREMDVDEDERKYLEKIPEGQVRSDLETLARIAAKIESGEIKIEKAVGRAKKTFIKELGIVLLMAAAAAILVKIFVLK